MMTLNWCCALQTQEQKRPFKAFPRKLRLQQNLALFKKETLLQDVTCYRFTTVTVWLEWELARLIVEFMGPTGVGKTTASRSILARLNGTEWQSLNDHIETPRRRITPPEFNETESLLLELRLANLLSAGMRPNDLLHTLFVEYQHMSFEVQNRHFPSDNLYVACEHIFQLFIAEMNFLILHKPENLHALLEDRAFVFMTRPISAILSNVKQRRASGEYRAFANGASDQQLLQSINWFVSRAPSLKNFIKKNGRPFIEVNLEDKDAEDKITAFLEALAKRQFG